MSSKPQLVNFDRLKQILDLRGFEEGHDTLVLSREGFEWLLREYVASFPFDAEWYCAVNDDVQQAITSGNVEDAKTHFVTQGYIEGRSHCPADFDETRYLEQNDDLREAHASGDLADLRTHFVHMGFFEGRRF